MFGDLYLSLCFVVADGVVLWCFARSDECCAKTVLGGSLIWKHYYFLQFPEENGLSVQTPEQTSQSADGSSLVSLVLSFPPFKKWLWEQRPAVSSAFVLNCVDGRNSETSFTASREKCQGSEGLSLFYERRIKAKK